MPTATPSAGLDLGSRVIVEKVGKFCFLGDMINTDGGAGFAVVTRIRNAWNKFRKLAPLLTHKRNLSIKGKLYSSYVRSRV